jgi:uncharacterized membrane protein
MTTTTPPTTTWPAPPVRALTASMPSAAGHLDRLYGLLDAAVLDRDGIRRALDDYTRHLDDHTDHIAQVLQDLRDIEEFAWEIS